MSKVRDFTGDNLTEIESYIEELNDSSGTWDNAIVFFCNLVTCVNKFFFKLVQAIVSFFIETFALETGEVELYYKWVLEKNEELKTSINDIFKAANSKDKQFAAQGGKLLSGGNEILKELNYLISIASPENISNIANSVAPNIIITYAADSSTMSDEELIEFCNSNVNVSNSPYLEALCEANSSILDIDGMDLFLVMLFKGKDIGVQSIVDYLNGNGGTDARRWITEQILNGNDGFMTVSEITKRVGCDETMVLEYLKNGKFSHNTDFSKDPNNAFLNEVNIKNGIDQIIAEHVQMVYSDDKLLEQYCLDNDLDADCIKVMKKEGYSKYEERLYYENLGKLFESAGDSAEYKKNFDLKLSDAKKFIGLTCDGKSIWDETTPAGKELARMWKNDIFTEAEARKFLKTYCGYDVVTEDDANLFRNLTENVNSLGNVKKMIGKSQQGLDALAYWTADYTKEIELLDSVMASVDKDSTYYVALNKLKGEYTEKFQTTLEKAVESWEKDMVNNGINAVFKAVPGIGIVETAIGIVGEISDASGYTGTVVDLMAYPEITDQMLSAYNNSVAEVATGNIDATDSVRMNFTMLKETLSSYYDKNCKFYEGMKDGYKKDPAMLAYSQYMKSKIDGMELGQSFEFQTYEEYISERNN